MIMEQTGISDQHKFTSAYRDVSDLFTMVPEERRPRCDLLTADVTRLAGLAAWRVSQGIYRIDPTIMSALMNTRIKGEVPVNEIMKLPEWCIYVMTPGMTVCEMPIYGFFAYLDSATYSQRSNLPTELRILLDVAIPELFYSLRKLSINLWSGMDFETMLLTDLQQTSAINKQYHFHNQESFDNAERAIGSQYNDWSTILAILVYICTEQSEYTGSNGKSGLPPPISNYKPKKTKDGWRLFAPDRPKIWCIGDKTGKEMRDAETSYNECIEHGQEWIGPRPHTRRAHLHGYWYGPRSEASKRRFKLLWLRQIAVALAPDTPEARMRHAKLKPIKNLGAEIDIATQELGDRI